MRGKQKPALTSGFVTRNIPAYAGKTDQGQQVKTITKEHPRVCGENGSMKPLPHRKAGTSPRMRGKRWRHHCVVFRWRNIPAYAGKTECGKTLLNQAGEHPRVCGENRIQRKCQSSVPGTSPRMRGKHSLIEGVVGHVRNIPAYAGKTSPAELHTSLRGEHPRVCGEN